MMTYSRKRVRFGVAIAGLACAAALSGCLPYSTGTTEVGVRTNKLPFGDKGVQAEYYAGGTTHFFVPFFTDWHTFDTKDQILDMTMVPGGSGRNINDDLTFKTIDGNDISLDVKVTYTIIPEKAPHILQHVATTNEELRENIVRTVARSKPRDIFGELNTEDFSSSQRRSEKEEEATERLNLILEPYGVRVVKVATVNFRFNPEYQAAIEDKKVADQQVEKNKSAAKAATEEYLQKVEVAKGEVGEMKAEADGAYQVAVIEADAYYEQQEKLAEAIIAEAEAEAEAIFSMNEALAGSGGEAIVKLEIAKALVGKRIMMLPIGGGGLDVRSTDINSLLELYGVQSVAGQRNVGN